MPKIFDYEYSRSVESFDTFSMMALLRHSDIDDALKSLVSQFVLGLLHNLKRLDALPDADDADGSRVDWLDIPLCLDDEYSDDSGYVSVSLATRVVHLDFTDKRVRHLRYLQAAEAAGEKPSWLSLMLSDIDDDRL